MNTDTNPVIIMVEHLDSEIARLISEKLAIKNILFALVEDSEVAAGKFAFDLRATEENGLLNEFVYKNHKHTNFDRPLVYKNDARAKAGVRRLSRKHHYRK